MANLAKNLTAAGSIGGHAWREGGAKYRQQHGGSGGIGWRKSGVG